MKLSSLRRPRARNHTGVSGPAMLDRRTRSIVKRLRPGDIAVIDHVDIDRAAAVALVESRVCAVVNLAPSISGRYPNLGPQILLDADIVLLDDVDAEIFTLISDGDVVRVDGDTVYVDDEAAVSGVRQDHDSVAAALAGSRDGIASQLEAFSANTVEHLRRDQRLLLDGVGVPATETKLDGRQVVVVLRAFDHERDLHRLKTYIKENSPVLVGVDAGADALIAAGHRPHLVVTSGEDISDKALRCGAEVVAHTTPSKSGAIDRLERLGVTHEAFATNGTSEDAALLLAHVGGAELIVTVGSHSSLVEFLDKGRSGMASSFLTRSTVGSKLVDAKAVAPLYQHRYRGWLVLFLMLMAAAAVLTAIATTPVGQDWYDDVSTWAGGAWDWAREQAA
ncbi:MAG: hypothetical protein H0X54_04035 [Propionibacteriales bacterium]|jgi:uncharacterized membrane-anchored protein|nr:hypothetical protein [Propionibacteriales bacterium]